MPRRIAGLTVIVCAMCATVGCSNSRANAASAASAGATGASASAGGDTGAVALQCTKVFSADDVVGLLKAPVTMSQLPRRSEIICNFGNDELGDVMVSAGGDESAEQWWDEATRSSDRVKFVPFSGVGDQAMFKAGTSAENPDLRSKKGSMYCLVTIDAGTDGTYKQLGGADLAKKLGALCNKAFGALGA